MGVIDNGIVSSLFCPRKSSGNRRVKHVLEKQASRQKAKRHKKHQTENGRVFVLCTQQLRGF